MPKTAITYRVGLIFSTVVTVADYDLKVGDRTFSVRFNNVTEPVKYSDLIITDKQPDTLTSLPVHHKDCHGTTLILNQISNPLLEQQYETIFTKCHIKYKILKGISEPKIIKSVNSELIKSQVKEGRLEAFSLLFNKYTFKDLISSIFSLSWLLLPFLAIIIYLLVKYIGQQLGYSFSFLCWFVEYQPDCKNDILEELKLLALLYSIFNFKFYFDYILSIFDNINNDVFQFSYYKKVLHKVFQFFIPLIFFISSLIIVKALFVFKYSFRIASENSFIDIGSILDQKLPFLKDDYLIYYFLVLDILLWLITKNFLKCASTIQAPFTSNRQLITITEAKQSFKISITWDILIIITTALLFNSLITDVQSKLAIQLILLQSVYLYINISTIFDDFKYR